MIFIRYLIKEIMITMMVVTSIILLIFISNQMIRYLGASASGQLFGSVIWKLIFIQIPYYMGLFLPLGLYLGTILSLSRWTVDHELLAWWASGISNHRILKICMFLGAGISLLVALLNLWVNPWLLQKQQTLLQTAKTATLLQAISPGRFISFSSDRNVAYVEKISPNRQELSQVFLAIKDEEEKDHWDILLARKGNIHQDEQTNERYLVTTNGYRYMGQPGHGDYRIVKYGSYALLNQDQRSPITVDLKENSMNLFQLIAHGLDKPKVLNELLWRFSLPLSVFILILFAIPLSETGIRQGRYAKLLPAILLYIAYANLLLLSRESFFKNLSPWISFCAVHLGMGMIGVYWYLKQQNILKFFMQKSRWWKK